jgi:transcriptional regulator with XRE-family HTH domain
MKVHRARTKAGLTQGQLAALIGTHQSAISRLEDADYEGHSLDVLKRIARVLGQRLRVEFLGPPKPKTKTSAYRRDGRSARRRTRTK